MHFISNSYLIRIMVIVKLDLHISLHSQKVTFLSGFPLTFSKSEAHFFPQTVMFPVTAVIYLPQNVLQQNSDVVQKF